jgi:hypothetical protein
MNPKKPADRKKLLIYAGVAGAMLALVVLMKRKTAGTAEEAAGSSLPTYTSGPSSIPGVGGENTGELATFENSLSAQLPQAIESGVRAGLAANQTNTTPNNSLAEMIAALGGFATSIRSTPGGEQVGGLQASPSQPAPAPTPAPVVAPPPRPAPAPPPPKAAPPPAYKTITCGNGCPGHKYPDGHSECMTKKAGKCSW